MNSVAMILQIIKANFLEQIRRDKFFLTMLATLALIIAAVPPPKASHTIVTIGTYRLLYNSAWIGSLVATLTSIILALPGFYLIRGSVEKDKIFGICNIYATGGSGKLTYLIGKFLSNVAVLLLFMVVAIALAILLQLNFGEDNYIHLGTLLAPFIMFTVPSIILVSALSIVFEITPGISGLAGNILYIGVWVGLLSISIQQIGGVDQTVLGIRSDVFGISTMANSVVDAVHEKNPGFNGKISFGMKIKDANVISQTLRYDDEIWSMPVLLNQLIWSGVGCGLLLITGVVFFHFNRGISTESTVFQPVSKASFTPVFDTHFEFHEKSESGTVIKAKTASTGSINRQSEEWLWLTIIKQTLLAIIVFPFNIISRISISSKGPKSTKRKVSFPVIVFQRTHYREEEINLIFPAVQKFVSPIMTHENRHSFSVMLRNELISLAKDTAWWWSLVMILLVVVCAVAPFDIMRTWLLPIAWIWPLLIWSNLGMRVSKHFRDRQREKNSQKDYMLMNVLWVAGVVVAMIAGSGAAIQYIFAGEWELFAVWVISTSFIPSFAFVLAIWTDSNYAFEGAYILLWILGSVSEQPILDFMGTVGNSIVVQNPLLYFICTLGVITFATVGSQRFVER